METRTVLDQNGKECEIIASNVALRHLLKPIHYAADILFIFWGLSWASWEAHRINGATFSCISIASGAIAALLILAIYRMQKDWFLRRQLWAKV